METGKIDVIREAIEITKSAVQGYNTTLNAASGKALAGFMKEIYKGILDIKND